MLKNDHVGEIRLKSPLCYEGKAITKAKLFSALDSQTSFMSEFSLLNLSWVDLISGDFPDFRLKGFWQRIWKYESQVI